MKYKINIDRNLDEDLIVINAKEYYDIVEKLTMVIEEKQIKKIQGTIDKEVYFIETTKIEYFYTSGQKVFAKVDSKDYEVKRKIYELEALLTDDFFKINQGVIGNIKKIVSVKALLNGTLEIKFESGSKEFASRRNVTILRRKLGV
jgi:DNA-binding LytR/AlgR family response regulator